MVMFVSAFRDFVLYLLDHSKVKKLSEFKNRKLITRVSFGIFFLTEVVSLLGDLKVEVQNLKKKKKQTSIINTRNRH
jgi:choline-glycine betaine transporter